MLNTRTAILWERQPKESAQAYEAFAIYRDMGADRSLVKVGQKCGKNTSLMERWSREWNWSERVRSWDNELTAKVKEDAEKTVAEMVQRHIKIALQMQTKAVTAFNSISADEITARDALAMLKLGLDLVRICRGEPTEITSSRSEVNGQVTIASDPYSELSVEELRKLARLADEL